MTSKEALEKICLHCEHYHQDMCYRAIAGCEEWHKLEKDLEELEELKKLMGTPIQDIMKRLKRLEKQDKILEILKVESCLIWVENGKLYSGRYGDIEIPLDEWDFNGKENQETIKEWLDEKEIS